MFIVWVVCSRFYAFYSFVNVFLFVCVFCYSLWLVADGGAVVSAGGSVAVCVFWPVVVLPVVCVSEVPCLSGLDGLVAAWADGCDGACVDGLGVLFAEFVVGFVVSALLSCSALVFVLFGVLGAVALGVGDEVGAVLGGAAFLHGRVCLGIGEATVPACFAGWWLSGMSEASWACLLGWLVFGRAVRLSCHSIARIWLVCIFPSAFRMSFPRCIHWRIVAGFSPYCVAASLGVTQSPAVVIW